MPDFKLPDEELASLKEAGISDTDIEENIKIWQALEKWDEFIKSTANPEPTEEEYKLIAEYVKDESADLED